MLGMDAVLTKYAEARDLVARLASAKDEKEFYPTLNAFLTAARSVLYVMSYQYGWGDLKKSDIAQFANTPQQEADRKRFDTWADGSPSWKAVLDHPLTAERHDIIHKSGQSSFIYYPPPIGGLAITPGTPFRGSWTTRGLPITTEGSSFRYRRPDKSEVDALLICREYLELIRRLVEEVKAHPW